MASPEKQLEFMQDFLINIADGNFDARLEISNDSDEEIVAMQVGINMLVEELKSSTISRVFLNSIYDGINDILIVLNEKGEIQKTNHLVESLLLFPESELFQQPLEILIQKEDREIVNGYIKNAYQKQTIQEAALNLIAKNHSNIAVSCSFSVLYNSMHQPSGVLLVAKNLSALLQAKNLLQDKNDELNLFVYKASHDLKGPISSLQGIMNLLNKSEDISEVKIYCKLIDECTRKLDTIISDLLVLGRVSYGELKFEKIDIKNIIYEIFKNFEFVNGLQNIDFNIDIHNEAQFIKTEKELLYTILFNLIDNAIKYRQNKNTNSFLNITAKNHDKGVLLTIEDNGIGIEELLQENIFKMFYRATYNSKGSGLGLYIVKMSVLKLGGNISFESKLDKGTTFTLYIPNHSV